mgnify:CR=1 FL=1
MIKKCMLLLSLCLLLLLPAGECSQGEYLITDQDLIESQTNLKEIKSEANLLQMDLEQSNNQLLEVLKQLEISKAETSQLKILLQQSLNVTQQTKTESTKLTDSLQKNNNDLKEYSEKIKSELKKRDFREKVELGIIAYLLLKQ